MSAVKIIRNLVIILALIWRINLAESSVDKGLRWVIVVLGQLSGNKILLVNLFFPGNADISKKYVFELLIRYCRVSDAISPCALIGCARSMYYFSSDFFRLRSSKVPFSIGGYLSSRVTA